MFLQFFFTGLMLVTTSYHGATLSFYGENVNGAGTYDARLKMLAQSGSHSVSFIVHVFCMYIYIQLPSASPPPCLNPEYKTRNICVTCVTCVCLASQSLCVTCVTCVCLVLRAYV